MSETDRFEANLDAALRHAPEVDAPRNFRQRLIARLPETPAPERPRSLRLPALAALAGVVLEGLALTAVHFGLAGWLAQPSMLFTVLGIESAAAIAWLWRTVRG